MKKPIAVRGWTAVLFLVLFTAAGCREPDPQRPVAQTTTVPGRAAPAQTERPSSKPAPSTTKPLNSETRRSAASSLSFGDEGGASVLTTAVIKR